MQYNMLDIPQQNSLKYGFISKIESLYQPKNWVVLSVIQMIQTFGYDNCLVYWY